MATATVGVHVAGAGEEYSPRTVGEVLRLHRAGVSVPEIARRTRYTEKYVKKFITQYLAKYHGAAVQPQPQPQPSGQPVSQVMRTFQEQKAAINHLERLVNAWDHSGPTGRKQFLDMLRKAGDLPTK